MGNQQTYNWGGHHLQASTDVCRCRCVGVYMKWYACLYISGSVPLWFFVCMHNQYLSTHECTYKQTICIWRPCWSRRVYLNIYGSIDWLWISASSSLFCVLHTMSMSYKEFLDRGTRYLLFSQMLPSSIHGGVAKKRGFGRICSVRSCSDTRFFHGQGPGVQCFPCGSFPSSLEVKYDILYLLQCIIWCIYKYNIRYIIY